MMRRPPQYGQAAVGLVSWSDGLFMVRGSSFSFFLSLLFYLLFFASGCSECPKFWGPAGGRVRIRDFARPAKAGRSTRDNAIPALCPRPCGGCASCMVAVIIQLRQLVVEGLDGGLSTMQGLESAQINQRRNLVPKRACNKTYYCCNSARRSEPSVLFTRLPPYLPMPCRNRSNLSYRIYLLGQKVEHRGVNVSAGSRCTTLPHGICQSRA